MQVPATPNATKQRVDFFAIKLGLLPLTTAPALFLPSMPSSVRVSTIPTIKNAPLEGLAEGNGSFSNLVLAALVLGVPYYVKKWLPLVRYGGLFTYLLMVLLLGAPITIAYWTVMSTYGGRKNSKVQLPGKEIEHYITLRDPMLKIHYGGTDKIPMQVFHDAYFDGKADFKGMLNHSFGFGLRDDQ